MIVGIIHAGDGTMIHERYLKLGLQLTLYCQCEFSSKNAVAFSMLNN